MTQIEKLYDKTKEALELTNKNYPDRAIEIIKLIQKEVKELRDKDQLTSNELNSLEIISLNNLACAYNKKNKFKSSLYYLQLASSIEEGMRKEQNSSDFLHQIATTHSNMCATYSQMGNHDQALQEITFSIDTLFGCEETRKSYAMMVCYFNCAMELEYLSKLNEAIKVAEKGLSLSKNVYQEMENRFVITIERLKEKLKDREKKVTKRMAESFKSRSSSTKRSERSWPKENNLDALGTEMKKRYESESFRQSLELPKNKTLYPVVKLPSFIQKTTKNIIKSPPKAKNYQQIISAYEPKKEQKNYKNYRATFHKKETKALNNPVEA